jgi:hypothetical protein
LKTDFEENITAGVFSLNTVVGLLTGMWCQLILKLASTSLGNHTENVLESTTLFIVKSGDKETW